MIKVASVDPHSYARSLCAQAACEKLVVLAEVFVRVAESWRSERLDREPSIHQSRRETGVALRVWDRQGHQGFVHADDIAHRSPGDLTRSAIELLALQRGSPPDLVPRLPGSEDESHAAPEGGAGPPGSSAQADPREPADRLSGWLETARAAFESRGALPFRHPQIEIERGMGRAWIINSLGRDISIPFAAGSVGVQARVGDSTMRYEAILGTQDIPPDALVAAVLREAESRLGRAVVPATTAPVLLAPRASAIWLRWVADRFVKRSGESEAGVLPLPFRKGFHIVDDPVGDPYDGEGREARRRSYLRDGQLADRIIDSRDPSARAEDLGPMRRDSYRDAPAPGALHLTVPAQASTARPALDQLNGGLHVTSLAPRGAPGSDTFLAEVRGWWIEPGRPPRAVGATLLKLEEQGGLGRVVAWGADDEEGPPGVQGRAPSLLFDRAELIRL